MSMKYIIPFLLLVGCNNPYKTSYVDTEIINKDKHQTYMVIDENFSNDEISWIIESAQSWQAVVPFSFDFFITNVTEGERYSIFRASKNGQIGAITGCENLDCIVVYTDGIAAEAEKDLVSYEIAFRASLAHEFGHVIIGENSHSKNIECLMYGGDGSEIIKRGYTSPQSCDLQEFKDALK